MNDVIAANNVTKRFSHNVVALNGLSLNVQKGQSFALLGPNGAGKTTFVKCLLGLTRANSGDIYINGQDCRDSSSRVSLAYLPEKFSFYPFYTVAGVLSFYGQMRGVLPDQLSSEVDRALDAVGISQLRHHKVRTLSKGQLQRTGIATLLMGKSEIMILDEPFSGIDPVGMKELKDLLVELKGQGITLFINSHILAEMAKICDSMAILNHGKCLVQGEIQQLLGADQDLEDYFYRKVKSNSL